MRMGERQLLSNPGGWRQGEESQENETGQRGSQSSTCPPVPSLDSRPRDEKQEEGLLS